MDHLGIPREGIVADAHQPVGRLPSLTDGKRHQLPGASNDIGSAASADRCVHHLFEAQVKKTPDAVALERNGQALSYRQLNGRANQLARRLRKLGVGPEVCVGLCMERSLDMVIGLFGILKAGGAYVPLDPTHPRDRIAFLLEDSQAPVLLTQHSNWAAIP